MELFMFTLPGQLEVIAKMTNQTEVDVTIEHPLIIRPIQVSPGQFKLDLYPYSLANPDGSHKLNKSHIVSASTTIPDMLQRAYTERTTNILLASAVDDMARIK